MALFGHAAVVAVCLLSGPQRTSFARSEYFAFGPEAEVAPDKAAASAAGVGIYRFRVSAPEIPGVADNVIIAYSGPLKQLAEVITGNTVKRTSRRHSFRLRMALNGSRGLNRETRTINQSLTRAADI